MRILEAHSELRSIAYARNYGRYGTADALHDGYPMGPMLPSSPETRAPDQDSLENYSTSAAKKTDSYRD